MQPYLFPYIGYFQMIRYTDIFVLYNDVNFIERGWINRNYILNQGTKQLLTVPLDKASSNRLINEIAVKSDIPEYEKNLRKIKYAYQKAPFFHQVYPMIEDVFLSKYNSIDEMAECGLKKVMAYLNIKKEWVKSSDIEYDREAHKEVKLRNIIEILSVDSLGLPPGSKSLYKSSDFENTGVSVFTIEPVFSSYPQYGSKKDFIPALSIIDVIMNQPKQKVIEQLDNFTLLPLK